MTMNIIQTSEWKGQQFCLEVVVPLTCYDYYIFTDDSELDFFGNQWFYTVK